VIFTYPKLDVPTLTLSVGVLSTILACVSFTFTRNNPINNLGLAEWGKSMSCAAIALILISFAGHLPFFVTFLVANIFAISLVPFGILAFSRLFDKPAPLQIIFATCLFGISGVVNTYFFSGSRSLAIFCMSTALAVQLLTMAVIIFRRAFKNSATLLVILALASIVSLSIMHMRRAYTAIAGDFISVIPTGNSATQVLYYFCIAAFLSIVSIAFFAISNEKVRSETIERLRRDGLTGLLTRTAFFEMEKDIEKIGKKDGYALLMIDIDHFKRVNDSFGHGGGDIVLAHVARLISGSLRLSDIAVRLGGEEFCVLLRGCNESDAAQLAQRIVCEAGMQSIRLPEDRSTRVTLSVGYTCMQTAGSDPIQVEALSAVIGRADQALYRAKENGRDQVVSAAIPQMLNAVQH
jgi:diguanylate cyclase (GGDEF)-like protein